MILGGKHTTRRSIPSTTSIYYSVVTSVYNIIFLRIQHHLSCHIRWQGKSYLHKFPCPQTALISQGEDHRREENIYGASRNKSYRHSYAVPTPSCFMTLLSIFTPGDKWSRWKFIFILALPRQSHRNNDMMADNENCVHKCVLNHHPHSWKLCWYNGSA